MVFLSCFIISVICMSEVFAYVFFPLIPSDDARCFFFIPLLTRAQTIMKARLKGAQTGRNLLKKKSDALTLRFRQILKKIIEVGKLEFSFVWLTLLEICPFCLLCTPVLTSLERLECRTTVWITCFL